VLILLADFLENYDVKSKEQMLGNGLNFEKIVSERLEITVLCMDNRTVMVSIILLGKVLKDQDILIE